MPVSIEQFKDYAGLLVEAQAGTKSQGIVTVRRADVQSQTVIPIAINTVFSVATGQSFQNPEIAELSESQTFIPLLLQSVATGAGQNIPATSEWNSPIAGITLYNGSAFSGGQDPVLESNKKNYMQNKFNPPSDSVVRLVLSQAQRICMGMIGNPSEVPDTATFETGVYFLARYYLETRTKEQSQNEHAVAGTVWEEKVVNQGIEDTKIHEGVMRILTGILTADRAVTSFMPEVQNGSG